MKSRSHCPMIPIAIFCLSIAQCTVSSAASFLFGTEIGGQNSLIFSQLDRSSATLVDDSVAATFVAGPAGGRLDDRDEQGLGIDTSQLDNVSDGGSIGDTTKFNIIDGSNSRSGQGESIAFSFDRPGILETLLFDGMKDETLEYYELELPSGERITIFDSQTEFRLGLQGFSLSDLSVPNPVMAPTENDDLTGIGFAFNADDVFVLTYGEGDYTEVPGYRTNPALPAGIPNTPGNGARFQGVVVTTVPEPGAAMLACTAVGAMCLLFARQLLVTRL